LAINGVRVAAATHGSPVYLPFGNEVNDPVQLLVRQPGIQTSEGIQLIGHHDIRMGVQQRANECAPAASMTDETTESPQFVEAVPLVTGQKEATCFAQQQVPRVRQMSLQALRQRLGEFNFVAITHCGHA
jgi:hypothetical protein